MRGSGGAPAGIYLPMGFYLVGWDSVAGFGEFGGDHVCSVEFCGRIGGSEDPFVADRAVFTIVDPSLKSCADMADPEHCTTPWDYCCEERGSLKRGTATIEFAGSDGRPLKGSVRGISGLDPLATVAVTGTVTERNDAGMLVVRATKVEIR